MQNFGTADDALGRLEDVVDKGGVYNILGKIKRKAGAQSILVLFWLCRLQVILYILYFILCSLIYTLLSSIKVPEYAIPPVLQVYYSNRKQVCSDFIDWPCTLYTQKKTFQFLPSLAFDLFGIFLSNNCFSSAIFKIPTWLSLSNCYFLLVSNFKTQIADVSVHVVCWQHFNMFQISKKKYMNKRDTCKILQNCILVSLRLP